MLIVTPETPEAPQHPRLDYVLGELAKAFRPKRRVHRADPESRRNVFVAMCRRCEWQRDQPTSGHATDLAMAHEREKHGVLDGGLVRVECR